MIRLHFILRVMRGFLVTLVVFLSLNGVAGHPTPVLAAGNTYTVNSNTDLPDADQGDGLCLTSVGTCTLRAAIMQANYLIGADAIILPAGLYQLTRPGDDDVAVLGDLDITDNLTIQGAGSGVTIVDGNGLVTADRVFQITATTQTTSLAGLTIQNGKKDANTFDEGGGIYWDGSGSQLNLSDVVIENNISKYGGGIYINYSSNGDIVNFDQVIIRNNSAAAAAGGIGVNFGDYATFDMHISQVYSNTAYEGGGIYFQNAQVNHLHIVNINDSQIYSNKASLSAGFENRSGDATVPVILINTTFAQNQAAAYGGAIGNYGTLDISTSTLDGNTAGARGGGIYDYEGGQVNLNQSTLSNNSAQYGGAIYSELFLHNTSLISITNSTLSGNIASRDGGGIYAQGGQISLFNATIAYNLVVVPGGITYPGVGGGVYINPPSFLVTSNTLFGDNTHQYQALPPEQDDCYGSVDSLGNNLFEQTLNCSITGTTNGNLTGLDPRLGTLKNIGGSTKTLLPLYGSPVIDAGHTPFCTDGNGSPLSTDQRGVQRSLGAGCDIGAVESLPYAVILPTIDK
jgi:predicted outer membrane repeat protein